MKEEEEDKLSQVQVKENCSIVCCLVCSSVCAGFHALLLGVLVLRKPLVMHRVRKTYYETKECKNKSREDKRLPYSEDQKLVVFKKIVTGKFRFFA